MKSLLRLLPYLARYKRPYLLGLASVRAGNALAVWGWSRVRDAVDAFGRPGTTPATVILSTLAVLGIFLGSAVLRFLMRWLMSGASRRVECDFRNDIFAAFARLPPAYYDRHMTGDLLARPTNDMDAVRAVLGPGLMYPANALFLFPAVLYTMLRMSPPLTAAAMAPLLIMPFLVRSFGRAVHTRFRRVQEQYSAMSARVGENLTGMRVVKAFAREDEEVAVFRAMHAEYRRRNMRLMAVRGVFFPLMRLVAVVGQIVIVYVGARLIGAQSHGLTYGGLLAFIGLHGELTWPLLALGWVVNVIERGAVSMRRILDIVDAAPLAAGTSEAGTPEAGPIADGLPADGAAVFRGAIEFRNLTFAYNGAPVLRDITFAVAPGTTLGIVGPVGCGKSTLLKLVARLYRAPRGTLCIDGLDIGDIPNDALRRTVAMVPQEPFLFSDTLRENILFGAGAPGDDGAMRRAAALAQIADTIESFPGGYDTPIGERGVNLSGGQKQRTAIARALVRDAPVVLLDDCLSSVDTATERKILDALRAALRGRTVLIVSHRVSTVAGADRIIVLQDGRIAASGTHDALLARGGLYAELARRQRLMDEIERSAGGGNGPETGEEA